LKTKHKDNILYYETSTSVIRECMGE